jgi:hypothetical protein
MFSAPLRFNRPKNKPHATAAPQAHPVNPKLRRLFLSPKSALRWRIVSLKRKFRLQANAILCRIFLRVGAKVPQSLRTMYVVRMISQAEQNYRPQPYAGSLVLFRGRGLYENDPNMGWDALAELLENHEIGEGETQSRRDIMNEPLVEVLAQQLANVLASMRNLDAPQT